MKIVFALAAILLTGTGIAFAQQPAAPQALPGPQIVRIRTGSSCGWCTGWYNDNEMVIERGSLTTISRTFTNERKYPEVKTRCKVTQRDWNDLIATIDAKMLADFNGPIGCPGCVDQPIGWAEIDFADGTKKSVSFNQGGEPASISDLIERVAKIGVRRMSQAFRQKPQS